MNGSRGGKAEDKTWRVRCSNNRAKLSSRVFKELDGMYPCFGMWRKEEVEVERGKEVDGEEKSCDCDSVEVRSTSSKELISSRAAVVLRGVATHCELWFENPRSRCGEMELKQSELDSSSVKVLRAGEGLCRGLVGDEEGGNRVEGAGK